MTSSYYGEEEAETYYDIEINESTLSRSGFTKFCLPLNSKNRDDKSKMKLHNIDPGRIIYCDFYRSDYAKTLKSFEDQLVSSKDVDDELLDDNTISNLVVCFDNECKILRQDKDSGFFDGNGSSNNGRQQQEQQEQQEQQGEEEDERLAAENTVTAEDIKFVISTMKKEAAYDEMSIKQLFYGMDTAFTKRPTSHNINSKDSGSGKNYLLELVSSYYPDKHVILVSHMSDKAIFHREGIMVRENHETGKVEPIKPIIDNLESEIERLEEQEETEKKNPNCSKKVIRQLIKDIKAIKSDIKEIEEHAIKKIDLNNQIILCLDTPQESLYNSLMSLVSQDTKRDQKYEFVEKAGSGKLGTKNNMLDGTPFLCTTQVIDDTKTQRFQEKNRRFINVNPDTSPEKIGTANDLIGLQGGYLPEEYDELVVSRSDKEKARQIIRIIIAKLKQHTKHLGAKEHGLKIPFALSISSCIPKGYVWGMTVTDRAIKYLSIITKVHMDVRPKLVNKETGIFYPISTFEDLKETLNLMQVAASGARPYIVKWYNMAFIPCYQDRGGKPNEDRDSEDNSRLIAKEKYVAITAEQLAAKTKEVFGGRKPSNKELRDQYLEPLVNLGVIDKVKSEIKGNENIYLPVEEGDGSNLFHIFDDSTNLRLKVTNPDRFPTKNFLKSQFGILSNLFAGEGEKNKKNISCYKLVDVDRSEITVDELLNKYFDNPEECFIKDYEDREESTNNNDKEQEKGYSSNTESLLKVTATATATAAATNNILYQQQILTKQKNNFFSPPSKTTRLTRIHNNPIEQNTYNTDTEVKESGSPEPGPRSEPEAIVKAKGSFKCFYCDEYFHSNDERRNHKQQYHPDKPLDYPTQEDFDNRLER